MDHDLKLLIFLMVAFTVILLFAVGFIYTKIDELVRVVHKAIYEGHQVRTIEIKPLKIRLSQGKKKKKKVGAGASALLGKTSPPPPPSDDSRRFSTDINAHVQDTLNYSKAPKFDTSRAVKK